MQRRPQIDGKRSPRLPFVLRRFSKARPRLALFSLLLLSIVLGLACYSVAGAISGGFQFPSLPYNAFSVPLKPRPLQLPPNSGPSNQQGAGGPTATATPDIAPTVGLNTPTATAQPTQPTPTPAPASGQATASSVIPAYWSNESGPWSQLVQTHPAGTVAIANFNAGPPGSGDSLFAQEIGQAHSAGIKVVGYIHTGSGGRALSDIQTDINGWYRYQVDGIFLDESLANSSNLSYYQQVASMIRSAGGGNGHLIVMNAGWIPSTSQYLQAADIIVVFEGTTGTFNQLNVPAWMSDPTRFAVVIEGVGTSQIGQLLQSSLKSHIGYIYLLDGVQVYNRLPSFWSQETAALSSTYL